MEEEGRKCALVLAKLDPAFLLEARFFDYLNPDYSAIPNDDDHTILMTVHSVEQVAEIDPRCISDALDLSREVTGIHVEPIGWQTYPMSEWTDVSHKHYQRCCNLKYNQNLWGILKAMEAEGRIIINRLATNFIGLDYNPATLIIWEKVV